VAEMGGARILICTNTCFQWQRNLIISLPTAGMNYQLQIIDKFGLLSAKLHLMFAAYAMRQKKPWESQFVLKASDIVTEIGWEKRTDINNTEKIISYTLIVFSILIRIEMFLMLMVMSSVYWIYLIVLKKDSIVTKRFLFLVGIAITIHLANSMYFKNNEKWAESKSTYNLIMKLADNPSFIEENVSAVFSNSTWTANDFRLFKHFFYDLPNAFEQNKLKTIIKATPNNIFNLSQIKIGLDKVINYKHVLFVLAFLLMYAFFYINKKIALLHCLNLLLISIVFYSMTGNKEIFKERIFFPIYFFFVLFILLFQNNHFNIVKNRLLVIGLNAILLFSFLIILKDSIRLQSSDNSNDREIFYFLGKQNQYILDFNCVFPLSALI
jgi:hypothetical protein